MFLRRTLNLIVMSCIFFVFANSANAKLFTNAYISFELPTNWDCKLDGTEWVCVSQYAKQAKEAIIILTAKEVGPVDSLALYKAHLNTPKSLMDKSGKLVPSKVLHLKERQIAGHPWVDGMHLGSEIVSYYTRYLATVKDKLAILVTFSAHKEHYTKYSNDFLKAIESLRAVATKDILDSKPVSTGPRGGEVIGVPIVDAGDTINDLPPEPSSGGNMKMKLLGLALIIAALGIYLIKRKRN
jgi:hypothetical protein